MCKTQPLSLLPNAVGVPAESAETLPPTKCHLSIKVTTSTRNMDTTSESFLLLTQQLALQDQGRTPLVYRLQYYWTNGPYGCNNLLC